MTYEGKIKGKLIFMIHKGRPDSVITTKFRLTCLYQVLFYAVPGRLL